MSNATMLKQLRTSLRSLNAAQATQKKMVDQLIEALPDDKKKEAIRLINKARKGKVDVGEMMTFASGVRDIDENKLRKDTEKGVEQVAKKKKDVKASTTRKTKAKS